MDDAGKGAKVDWLAFTFNAFEVKAPAYLCREWVQAWLGRLVIGEDCNGLHGFEHSARFYANVSGAAIHVATVAFGGSNQRGRAFVSLTGSGCGLVKDWSLVRSVVEDMRGRITRIDLAVDALNGEFGVLDAAKWYEEGGFSTGTSGRRPTYRVDGDWLLPLGNGRTLYVGKRENGKYARVYEKGKQLGDKSSEWTRFEVELHDRDRVIPTDAITNPSVYFAGCYLCTADLVDCAAERIATQRAELLISLDKLKSYCRVAYGKLLYTLRRVETDAERLFDDLAIEGAPRRLETASLALIERAPPGRSPMEVLQ